MVVGLQGCSMGRGPGWRLGGRHLGDGVSTRPLSPADSPSPSQGQQLSTESLQQLLERALTPLVDEVKQRGLAPACPSCQRLHKKILVPGPVGHHAPLFYQRGGGSPGHRDCCIWQGGKTELWAAGVGGTLGFND